MKTKYIVMLAFVLVSGIIFAGCGNVDAMESASKMLNNYEINAYLDYQNKTLSADETLSYTNRTGVELTALKFHLYPNAFRQESLKYTAVSEQQKSRAYPNGFSQGEININSVQINNERINFVVENEDKNILTVPLNHTLKNQDIVDVEIKFSLLIPNCNHRFGYSDNTLNLGNWYPIICIFDNGDFVTSGYSPNGDPFYSEVANYKINISYPKDLILASSGDLINESEQNNEKTSTYIAKTIRDFACVFSTKFEVASDVVDETEIDYYYYDDPNFEQNLQVAMDAVATFNELFGAYPYKSLKIVKANFLQGGMEYPMLVYISDEVDKDDEYKNVIIHEIAHQWWYGVVGNNECEYAWLDEGLAEYSTALFYDMNPSYNKTSKDVLGSALSSYLLFCDVYRTVYDNLDTSMNRSIYEFSNETEYTYVTYVKGILMFDSIADIIGQNKMNKSLQYFYNENKFAIVEPGDLIAAFEKITHKKLASYIMSWLDGSVIIEELNN